MFPACIPNSLPQLPTYLHEVVVRQSAAIETYSPVLSPKLREIRARFSNQPVMPSRLVPNNLMPLKG